MEIWIADTDMLGVGSCLNQLLPFLSAADREKALRFLRREDRIRCTAGRLMIRALAAKHLGRPDVPLRFSGFGKPFFASENAPQFNLSHAGNLVVLAFADFPVGVDVEQLKPLDWHELAGILSEEERMLVNSAEDPLRLFYRFWTIREAFSKETGVGLSLLDSGRAEIDHTLGIIRYSGETLYYRYWEFPEYTLSLCAASVQDVNVHRLTAEDWHGLLALNGAESCQASESS